MKKISFLLAISVIIILVMPIYTGADGVCTLDKYPYHPGETPLFSCSCTENNEKNRDGFIVWINESGAILQNNSINSGDCKKNFFTSSYFLPVAYNNYTGNVTFSLNGDGSGIPVDWDDASDIINDTFNVSGVGFFDCIISNITASPITLGDTGTVQLMISDGITGNPLIHVHCQSNGYDIGGFPIIIEPYGRGETDRISNAGGEITFQREMSELFWTTNTTYLFVINCHCLDNTTDEECFDEGTGLRVGFKTCSASVPFITGTDDLRDVDKPFLPIVLVLIFTALFFLVTGFISPKLGFKVAGIGIGITQLVILAFLTWINRDGNSIIGILRMNFYILLVLSFGIGFIGLIFFVVRMMNVEDTLSDEKENKKWTGEKKGRKMF